MSEKVFDFLVLGSGLGGLQTAFILSKEGYNVCVVEKNEQFGGVLQSFKQEGVVYDTGIHYMGGLSNGETLDQMFKFFGLRGEEIEYKKLDESGFDHFLFEGDKNEYVHAHKYENFVERLVAFFPNEKGGLQKYVYCIKDCLKKVPIYNLDNADLQLFLANAYEGRTAAEVIEDCIEDPKLRLVLAGNQLLHLGNRNTTSFYEHAIIQDSYIRGAYRICGGAGQLANALVRNIRSLGGTLIRKQEIVSIECKENTAQYALLKNGERVYAKNFISNIHPAVTLNLLEGATFRKSYKSKIEEMENSLSAFVVYANLKPKSISYKNFNTYYFSKNEVWFDKNYMRKDWPQMQMGFTHAEKKQGEFSSNFNIMTFMDYSEVKEWEMSKHTTLEESTRNQNYLNFKNKKIEELLQQAEKYVPGLKNAITFADASTPLTYRDYLSSPQGSIYGIKKNVKNPYSTQLTAKSKVQNLYFTGQNLNLHGVLGVSISSLVSCSYFVSLEKLLKQIKSA